MRNSIKTILIIIAVITLKNSQAQDSSRIHITTGVGVNKIKGSLRDAFRSTIAFNSAVEIDLQNNWFAQGELNFNTLKYNQQKKDDNSSYLFQNTNSSLLLLGLNAGRNFKFKNSAWFTSVYAGTGYISVGEPRISVDVDNKIVMQTTSRRTGLFGKGGIRIGYKTKSKLLQTLYIDGAYWTSTVKTQGGMFRGLSAFIGMRMS
ncbi:MAG TPA: outer membrane beta-barrel protein, partial [Chitinophagaceae bacterium]|nr:outer membrane beta-barrel protein [Chitinophagaceae bacterium]